MLNSPSSIPLILIVDDDTISRRILQGLLEKEGFEVITAANGIEGRNFAEKQMPDLIIMDVMMPEEDGLVSCGKLKSNPDTAEIPIIFFSSVEDLSSKIDGFNAGGVDYITKPFQALEVIARIRLHIRLYHSYRSMVAANLEQLKHLTDSQKNILVQPKDHPEANFTVIFTPAQVAGGDFYDVIHAGSGIYDFIVADISGHDVGTALPAAALKALLRQNSSMLYSPFENINLINQHLRPVLQENQYATLIYARLNKARMFLTLVNAGHPSAIIQRASGNIEIISQASDCIGLFDKITLDVKEIPVVKGDRVFLFSDGLIEQNHTGSIPRRIGFRNLTNLIRHFSQTDLKTIANRVQEKLLPESVELIDDAVMLGFEVQ